MLYRLVQQPAASFIALTEASASSELPRFVKGELDAFFEYGMLAHQFQRLRPGEDFSGGRPRWSRSSP